MKKLWWVRLHRTENYDGYLNDCVAKYLAQSNHRNALPRNRRRHDIWLRLEVHRNCGKLHALTMEATSFIEHYREFGGASFYIHSVLGTCHIPGLSVNVVGPHSVGCYPRKRNFDLKSTTRYFRSKKPGVVTGVGTVLLANDGSKTPWQGKLSTIRWQRKKSGLPRGSKVSWDLKMWV